MLVCSACLPAFLSSLPFSLPSSVPPSLPSSLSPSLYSSCMTDSLSLRFPPRLHACLPRQTNAMHTTASHLSCARRLHASLSSYVFSLASFLPLYLHPSFPSFPFSITINLPYSLSSFYYHFLPFLLFLHLSSSRCLHTSIPRYFLSLWLPFHSLLHLYRLFFDRHKHSLLLFLPVSLLSVFVQSSYFSTFYQPRIIIKQELNAFLNLFPHFLPLNMIFSPYHLHFYSLFCFSSQ